MASTASRESPYLIEVVALLCSAPLILAYRLEGFASVTTGETLAILLCLWGLGSSLRTFLLRRRESMRARLAPEDRGEPSGVFRRPSDY